MRTYKVTHPSLVAASERHSAVQVSKVGIVTADVQVPLDCALTATRTAVITTKSLENMAGR